MQLANAITTAQDWMNRVRKAVPRSSKTRKGKGEDNVDLMTLKSLLTEGNTNSGNIDSKRIFTLSSIMNGKETGTWTQTAVGPSARFEHAMASLGNGKVLTYGGLDDHNYDDVNDAWIFTDLRTR